jgi:hypothetical protein
MDSGTWSAHLEALRDAIEQIQAFFQDRDPTTSLGTADLQTLERLFDRYLDADEAVATKIEVVLRRSTKRPRR